MSGDAGEISRSDGQDGRSGMASAKTHDVVKSCREQADKFIKSLFQLVFDEVDDELFTLSGKTQDDQERNLYFEGLRTIRLEREAIAREVRSEFSRRFSAAMRSEDTGKPSPAQDPGSGLSLVNDTQLEETLAVDNLVAKLKEHHSESLYGIEHRFNQLIPDAKIDKDKNPVGPDNVCRAFSTAVSGLDIDIKLKLFIYKVLDRLLMEEIGEFYHGLNKFMVARGILPTLKVEIRKIGGEAGRGGAAKSGGNRKGGGETPPGESSEEQDEHGGSALIHEQMFQAMKHLLMAHAEHSEEGVPAGGGSSFQVTPQLLDSLSALQHDDNGPEEREEILGGGLKRQVLSHFQTQAPGGGAAAINQIDDETIDVISMIFDYILDDRLLPDFVKALIGRLQIPVLKVAIIDREFFSKKSHPARQLLNELAHAGIGWNEESEATKDRLFEKMESVVMRILHDFDNDISIFETLLTEFQAFLEEEERNFDKAKEKMAEAVAEAGQSEKIKKQIAQEMAARMLNKPVPEDIKGFLMGPWRQVLSSICETEGGESAAFVGSLELIDDILWSLVPKKRTEERKELAKRIPKLLSGLRVGLEKISATTEESENIFKMLETYHMASMKGECHPNVKAVLEEIQQGQETATETPAAKKSEDDEIERMMKELGGEIDSLPEVSLDDFSDLGYRENDDSGGNGAFEKMMAEMGFELDVDEGPRIDDEYTGLVKGLELGTWVELTENNGGKTRVKLAWRGDEYTNFSFMNRQYKIVAERPLYVLADEFRQGRAAIVEEVALFDRAMDGVISGIVKLAGK